MVDDKNVKPPVIEEPKIVEGKVIYEQDLRAASHRNGRTPHVVEPEVGGGTGTPPTDTEEGDHLPDRPPAVRLTLGLVYLAAGGFLIYAGIVVLRDWQKQNNKEKD